MARRAGQADGASPRRVTGMGVLNLAASLWSRRPLFFSALAAATTAPVALYVLLAPAPTGAGLPFIWSVVSSASVGALNLLAFAAATLALAPALAATALRRALEDLRGAPDPAVFALRQRLADARRLIVYAIALQVPLLIYGALAAGEAPWAAFAVWLLISLLFFCAKPAAIVEELGPLRAANRSMDLTERRPIALLVAALIPSVIWLAVVGAIAVLARGDAEALSALNPAAVAVGAGERWVGVGLMTLLALGQGFLWCVQAAFYFLSLLDERPPADEADADADAP